MIDRTALVQTAKNTHFDLLIIGGGATGAGIALDAATRGLKTLLVEKQDFSQGTSSRSTKLVHGGVRYLEQAVKRFDRSQFRLVQHALKERALLLQNAPHLAKPLALLTPIYNTLEVPYYFSGLKLYDMLAGRANLHPSRLLGSKEATTTFPMLKAKGLRGAVLYYDGQFDDSRMNVALIRTAIREGAKCLNRTELTAFAKNEAGNLVGGTVRDIETGESYNVTATAVINATGPFCDAIREIDEPGTPHIVKASSGVHIVLGPEFSPPETGLLIPKTEDDRVLFLLPWHGHTVIGTTDNPAAVSEDPRATEEEVEYILRHVQKYFDLPVSKSDVLATWSGLRPLVDPDGLAKAQRHASNGKSGTTAALSRDHTLLTSASGLLTITGGKWTTYRHMAEEAVDMTVKQHGFTGISGCQTERLPVIGAPTDADPSPAELAKEYGIDEATAAHLLAHYGSEAPILAGLAQDGYGAKLTPDHPTIEAEAVFALKYELATSADDILERRTRLAFLDEAAAQTARARVENIVQELR